MPLQQQYSATLTFCARTAHHRRIIDEIRAVVASTNPNLPIVAVQTLTGAVGLVPQRVAASVSGGLGLVGLLLAAIGIYGVTAYLVVRRTREFGIRIALGAQRGDIVAMILKQGMSLVLIGSVVGLVLAAAAGRLLTAFLFGVSPVDFRTFSAAAALFFSVDWPPAICLPVVQPRSIRWRSSDTSRNTAISLGVRSGIPRTNS